MDQAQFKEKLLDLVGDKITAKEFDAILSLFLSIKPYFSNEIRIDIQEFVQNVGSKYSGAEFSDFLNRTIAPKL